MGKGKGKRVIVKKSREKNIGFYRPFIVISSRKAFPEVNSHHCAQDIRITAML